MTAELFYWSLFALAVGVGMWGAVKQHGHTSIEDGGTLSLSSSSLADSAVTTAKLAANAVTTVKITDAVVTAAKLASDVPATQADQETGSSTSVYVTPGRQQYHPSAAKAWALVENSAGTPSITVSYNVTSVTDNGIGDTTLNFTTSFSSTSFTSVGSVNRNDLTGVCNFYSPAASAGVRRCLTENTTTGAASDADFMSAHYGDQ